MAGRPKNSLQVGIQRSDNRYGQQEMPEISSNAARAGDVLLLLGECGPDGALLRELAEHLGVSRPALHRTLAALATRGFVEATSRRGGYRLGPAIYGLTQTRNATEARLTILRPMLYDIVAKTGYSAFLMVEAGLDALCLEMISPMQIRSLTGGAGGRVPLGIAAGSLAILSSLPPESRAAIISANADRYTNYPALRPMSPDRVQHMVEETITDGYSCDFGCFFPGEGGVGLVIPSARGLRTGLSVAISIHGEISSHAALGNLAEKVKAIFARHGTRL